MALYLSQDLLSRIFSAVIVICVAISMTACQSESASDEPGPDNIALEWWGAFLAPERDKLAKLTCQARQVDLEMSMNMLGLWTNLFPKALGNILGIGSLEVELSSYDVSSVLTRKGNANATVELKGKLRSSVEGISAPQEFKIPLQLVMENNQWVVCDKIVAEIVQQLTLGPLVGDSSVSIIVTPASASTLTVQQAVQATIQANQADKATATALAIIALTPTSTPTPTPLSAEDQQKAIATALARATQVADVNINVKEIDEATGIMTSSPNGPIMIAGRDGASFWDLSTGQKVAELTSPRLEELSGNFAFSSDGLLLAASGISDSRPVVTLWNTSDYTLAKMFEGTGEHFEFSPDGRFLAATATWNGGPNLTVWDLSVGDLPLPIYKGEQSLYVATESIIFSQNGRFLALLTSKYLNLYEIQDNSVELKLSQNQGDGVSMYYVAFDSTSDVLIVDKFVLGELDSKRRLEFWNASTGELEDTLIENRSPDGSVPFAVNSNQDLIATSDLWTINIWSISKRKLIKSWELTDRSAERLALHPSGKFLASKSYHDTIEIWQVDNGELIATINDVADVRWWAFTEDGQYLINGNDFWGEAQVWFIGDLLK